MQFTYDRAQLTPYRDEERIYNPLVGQADLLKAIRQIEYM